MVPGNKVFVTITTDGDVAGSSTSLFPQLETNNAEISAWLSNCPLYNAENGRWNDISRTSDLNMDSGPLRGAFQAIYSAVLECFHAQESSAPRWLVETRGSTMEIDYSASFMDQNGYSVAAKRAPDFCISGGAPTLPDLEGVQPVAGYRQCVSPIEIVREAALDLSVVEKNLYTFAWHCFANQPNRRHVNAILFTDLNVHMYLYDRHGTFRTRGYNIHSEAPTLVRILLDLAGGRADCHRFDPRVVYSGDSRSILFKNYFSCAHSSVDCSSELSVVGLLFNRSDSIQGRGTICWDVRMPSDPHRKLILKDYWGPFLCTPEWEEVMTLLKGLPGVAQILGYEDDAGMSISSLRASVINDGSSIDPKYDLVFTRILSEMYGEPLEHFNSLMHLLSALRDAISGHANMWHIGVLHRDVSINNILHGIPGAIAGEGGKMIDFDMAALVSENTKALIVGTRPFQSTILFASANKGQSQDHLDDLESFFYVLLYICCKYDGPGNPIPGYPNIYSRARFHRRRVLEGATTMQSLVTPYFSDNTVILLLRLLEDFATFFLGVFKEKVKLRRKYAKVLQSAENNGRVVCDQTILEALPTLQEIHEADMAADPMGKAHRNILSLVDSAIIGIEYMQEKEMPKTAELKTSSKAEAVKLLKHTTPIRGEKRARSSLREITNLSAKPKRAKGAVPVLTGKQDENQTV